MNYSAKDNAHTGNHMVPSVAITIISAYLVITLIGWFGNGNVVIATIKNRNLRSRCNILIAVQSFSEIFHQSAHLITAYFIYSGNYFVPLKRCFQLQLIPNLFMQFASALMLSIGFDRIFGVCFSNRYRKVRKNMYIFAVMIPAGAYSIMQVAAAYHSDRSEQLVVCTVVTIHTGWSQKLFMFGGCLLNITIVAFYVVMWIIIRHEGSKCSSWAKKLIKTLTLIVSFIIFGWLAGLLTFSATLIVRMDSVSTFYAIMTAGLFVNISVSCNFFLLYSICADYRIAFRRQLCLKRSTSTVLSVAQSVNVIHVNKDTNAAAISSIPVIDAADNHVQT